MANSSSPHSAAYDVASALWQGMRPYQEDSIVTDFNAGLDSGFAIVADGMGGHAAGDVASNLVAVHASDHLKRAMQAVGQSVSQLPGDLSEAIDKANHAIAEHVRQDRSVAGMGATMLALALVDDQLFWGSVGDSPLFLVRDGALRQLNQDHSMAPVIAAMVERGELTPEQGKQHPDRNALTSVLMGERLEKTDVPTSSFTVLPGDVLIAASDGLQFLENEQILDLILKAGPASSTTLCQKLMAALESLADPHQDNCAVVVVQRRAGDLSEQSPTPDTPDNPDTPEVAPHQEPAGEDGPDNLPVSSERAAQDSTAPSSNSVWLVLAIGMLVVLVVLFFLR